jgi:hypothetical protein
MKKTLVKWSCLAIGVLASCQQRDLSEGISSDSLALNLQASVAGEIISRTTTQQDGHTTFVQGDKIGFFMPEGDDAISWTLGESVWQPDTPLFWPDHETGGFVLGTGAYKLNLQVLKNQKVSESGFTLFIFLF